MSAPHCTRARSRAAFEAIARHVAGGESSYARLRAGHGADEIEAPRAAVNRATEEIA